MLNVQTGEYIGNEAADSYIKACSEMCVGSRRLGVLDESCINEALRDPTTVTITRGGNKLPLMVDIEYSAGAGYSVDRVMAMLEGVEEPIYYYSFASELTDEELEQVSGQMQGVDTGYIFYEYNDKTPQVPVALYDTFANLGYEIQDIPLLDEHAAQGNEEIAIVLYGAHVPENGLSHTRADVSDLKEAYYSGVNEGRYSDSRVRGPVLISGDNIDEVLADKLWTLYQDRFQWLGERHPISMEDTRESFMKVLCDKDTLNGIYFINNDPKCLAYFVGNNDVVEWLNPSFIEDRSSMGMSDDEKLLFFPGIVSNARGIAGYSWPVIELVTNVVSDSKGAFYIAFENTNRSEEYIPTMIKRYVDKVNRVTISEPSPIDRTSYHCARFERLTSD